MQPPARLLVLLAGQPVGHWHGASHTFTYLDAWLQAPGRIPLSLALPLSSEPHTGRAVDAFFDNLLPDGQTLLERRRKALGAQSTSAFDLLVLGGLDCAGAVSVLPLGDDAASALTLQAGRALPLSPELAAQLLDAGTTPRGVSLAGAQDKTALVVGQECWGLPEGFSPTTHILKFPVGLIANSPLQLPHTLANEHLCERLLNRMGITTAPSELVNLAGQPLLAVERFDRSTSAEGVVAHHQEDFCQVLSLPPSKKYEADGGPSPVEIAKVLAKGSQPDIDVPMFFSALVAFWLLLATDGHGKNFSIQHLPRGRYKLAPLYDVLSFNPYVGSKAGTANYHKLKMAMAARGGSKHYLHSKIQYRHFVSTGEAMGIAAPRAHIERVIHQARVGAEEMLGQDCPGCPAEFVQKLLGGVIAFANQLERMAGRS